MITGCSYCAAHCAPGLCEEEVVLGEGVIAVEEELVLSELGGATTLGLLLMETPTTLLALASGIVGLPIGLDADADATPRPLPPLPLPLPLPPGDTPSG